MSLSNDLLVKQLGIVDYQQVWQQMQAFTDSRNADTIDELWLVQHPPIFTLGQQGERGHIIKITDIPIIQTDRGGHVTYHGPGQLIAYPLLDLRRRKLGIRQLVTLLESIIIELLKQLGIESYARADAPGVYVNNNKIASIGLRVRKGYSYHGLALNVSMDLTPFSYINPCGMTEIKMTQIQDFLPNISFNSVTEKFIEITLNMLVSH